MIRSAPTRPDERLVAPHPSLKPQAFMRQIVRAVLPLGKGEILDPFMGAGSTIAAAAANGYGSIGIELDPMYFVVAETAIPALAQFGAEKASSGESAGGGTNIGAFSRLGADPHPQLRVVR